MNSNAQIREQSAESDLNSPNLRASSWSLRTRQMLAILSLEIRKNFLSRRAFLLYLIAGLPLVLLSLLALFCRRPTKWKTSVKSVRLMRRSTAD